MLKWGVEKLIKNNGDWSGKIIYLKDFYVGNIINEDHLQNCIVKQHALENEKVDGGRKHQFAKYTEQNYCLVKTVIEKGMST